MNIHKMQVGIYSANCYILWDNNSYEAAVVDPGGDVNSIYKFIKDNKLNVKYILLTHGHIDHCGGIEELKNIVNAPIGVNENDMILMKNGEYMFGNLSKNVDILLHENDLFKVGDIKIRCLETPGHTPGGMSFLAENCVFTGDTLFSLSIGRTDLPGGNFDDIINSIKNKLLILPEDTIVYPGHGIETSIGREKKYNSFLK